ncbi:hypothetical protein [Aquimarina sp. RZ0]|uniref:hypothetical protein n=1 Tax=Aquimarina sp. RZ0 TaxID=2607730 RepID=UPI0011F33EEC|nr:hypothetical protein [Aquimarina sp. RZ0]KAA1244611.1 hypothetical protein F0000_15940 [Aquimarina sp. RZ0]
MKILLYAAFVFLIVTSCAPKLSSTWKSKDYKGRTYTKIAVVGIGEDLAARKAFENNAVQLLKDNGIHAITGITIFPPKMSPKKGEDAKFIKILKDNDIDGVITMSLINTKESQRYTPGETYAVPLGYRRFGRYYYRTYSYISTPGYYQDEKSYLIEAVLYDVAGELQEGQNTLVWSGQSALINPSSSQNAAVTFTSEMVASLLNDMVILPSQN